METTIKTHITGEWAIVGYGRPADDYYCGPGGHDEMFTLCESWNNSQTAREQSYGDYARGTLQRWFIKRVG